MATTPTMPPPGGGSDDVKRLKIAAIIVAVIAGGLGAAGQAENAARALGGAIGTLLLIAFVSYLFRRFASRRAGLISAIVVGVLVIVSSLVQAAERGRTSNEIRAAVDELDLPESDFVPTAAENECLERSGFDQDDLLTALTDTGAIGADLQLELFGILADCAPRALQSDANVEGFQRAFASMFQADISDTEASCMLEGIATAPAPTDLIAGSDPEAYLALAESCLTAESLAPVLREPGAGAQAIGDDPDLDRLAEWCSDGSDLACDLLYENTSEGSEYFTLALGCGDRPSGSEFYCVAGMTDADVNGFIDTDAPGWATVIERCEGGEMLACDFTFATAELASDQERVGETCGGRRAVSNGTLCMEAYGEVAED